MKEKKGLAVMSIIIFLSFSGCCATFEQTISPQPIPNVHFNASQERVSISGIKTVAIFPFADYSHQQTLLGPEIWGGNIKILEEITDHFVAHGIMVAVQEDVNTLLADENIIQPIPNEYLIYDSKGTMIRSYTDRATHPTSPEYELLHAKHSEDMRDAIVEVIEEKQRLQATAAVPSPESPILQGATVGLTREKIVELGELLDVDLIIRGRIIEFGFKETGTYNPLVRGALPVMIEPLRDLLFGVASPQEYEVGLERVYTSQIGDGVGYLLGPKVQQDTTGTVDSLSEIILGPLAGLYPRRQQVSTIVQIRMYAQHARTGELLWSNRVETEFKPNNAMDFNTNHPRTMLEKTIRGSVDALMGSFFGADTPAAGS